MNKTVVVRKCSEYNLDKIYEIISDIYVAGGGPDVNGKKVLVKPNILIDDYPEKCISTHPVVVEAMVMYLQSKRASVYIGDSPGVHKRGFLALKSGINDVCKKTGAVWVDFLENSSLIKLPKGTIRTASFINEADLIISLPKLKNHELVYFTGAIKNSLGFVPGFIKARQHGLYHGRNSFSSFLIDLCEAITPSFFLMDGITSMEGSGPAQGTPVKTELLLGSTNPLALDIIACSVAGYDPLFIPTNTIALSRGKWLRSPDEIIYDGPDLNTIIKKDFKKIPVSGKRDIAVKFVISRLKSIRKLQRRPVFLHDKCTGCNDCIKICPQNAITLHPAKKNWVVLTDKKCIRCFCCSEVCQYNAIDVRRKFFGA
jgi:uncharacterized protein (DUF362 family)/Pyruvate/2-oxoacid:ferredoxin oxidoreductase delta subunit